LVAATERVNFIGIHRQYSYLTNTLNKLIAANKEQRNKEENNIKQFKLKQDENYDKSYEIKDKYLEPKLF